MYNYFTYLTLSQHIENDAKDSAYDWNFAASSEGYGREAPLKCQPIKGEIFSINMKYEHSRLACILISTGIVPNKNCMYRIDDMVMTEDQLLEAFGLVGKRQRRTGAQT